MNRLCFFAFLATCAALAAGAQTYDVAADFSATNNPNGPWSYGFALILGGPVTLYVQTDGVDFLDHWRANISGTGTPMLFHNSTTLTITSASTQVAPGGLGLHPGPDDEYSVARLTVPSAGQYRLTGSFFGIDTVGTTTDVHILTNGVSLLDGEVTGFGPGTGPSFDLQVVLSAGDQLDFAVGYGADAGFYDDSTGLSAQILFGPELLADSFTLTTETCTNNAIDPGERVTVSFGLRNVGAADTTSLVATLQPGGGVTSPTGPQTYGVLLAGGPAVAGSFTFTASGTCGGTNTATLQLQDGTNDLGTVTFTFNLGQTITTTLFSENFDSVIPPNLPTGWAISFSGAAFPWVTTTAASDTSPNSAAVPDVPDIGLSELDSPTINLPAGASQLSFRNYYNLEWDGIGVGFDGGVLEININGGGWNDILAAGGGFISGGYVASISTFNGNPLAGRSAWTGNSGGFITTLVSLPAAAAGEPIQLRWLCGTDNNGNWVGWYIDTVAITNSTAICCTPPVFTSVTDSGTVLTLNWSAVPGRTYQVFYTTNLVHPSWTALTTVHAIDFTATATDSITLSGQRFYRVALLP